MNMCITQNDLKELLNYNPYTGVFTWIVSPCSRVKIGDIAGCINDSGYITISIKGKTYRAHRLAFLYMEGSMPDIEVDHDNRIRSDNRWVNIKHATRRANAENTSQNNKFIGVYHASNKWCARASCENNRKWLGRYITHFAACYARHAFDVNR